MTLPSPRSTAQQPGVAAAGSVSGGAARVAGTRRSASGGRVAGQSYAPPAPRTVGTGSNWPYRDYSDVQPAALRETYEWWQAICRDVPPRRRARGWEQADRARESSIALSTVRRIERGEWTAAHNLFLVCSVLGLRVEQTVDVTDPKRPDVSTRAAPPGRSGLRVRVHRGWRVFLRAGRGRARRPPPPRDVGSRRLRGQQALTVDVLDRGATAGGRRRGWPG